MDFANEPDSRLWIGLDGVESALKELDAARVGVALVGFAGRFDDENRPETASWLEAPLTDDYSAIESGMERMRNRGPSGLSCHACAVRFAQSVLSHSRAAGRCPAIVLVGDTDPNRPYHPMLAGNQREFEDRVAANQREVATALAESSGLHFTLVALGEENLLQSEHMEQLLAPSGGKLVPVGNAGEVSRAIITAVDACE